MQTAVIVPLKDKTKFLNIYGQKTFQPVCCKRLEKEV